MRRASMRNVEVRHVRSNAHCGSATDVKTAGELRGVTPTPLAVGPHGGAQETSSGWKQEAAKHETSAPAGWGCDVISEQI